MFGKRGRNRRGAAGKRDSISAGTCRNKRLFFEPTLWYLTSNKTNNWEVVVVLKRNKRKRYGSICEVLPTDGRDEMNLAEFPIALLASRPDKTLKTIQFEDRIWNISMR